MSDSGASLGDILGAAIAHRSLLDHPLSIRGAKAGIVVNGIGSTVRSATQVVATTCVEATLVFIPANVHTLAKINSIRAIRDIDRSLGLKETKDFVEGEPRSGYFADAESVNLFVESVNRSLSHFTGTGKVIITLLERAVIYV